MKFGLSYNTGYLGTDPDLMVAAARHAEDCGFESFYVPEHIALYPGATYPGAPAGAATIPATTPVADPLQCLASSRRSLTRILLGTGVLLLPYHHPVALAKRLATLDVLSKGRMRLLTVGVGALPGEAAAGGVDFATRGRRADEAIDVLRRLWSGGEDGVSFDGEFFSFTRLCSYPKPLGPGSCPSTSAGPAWPRPAARACAATATSPAAASPAPNGTPSSSSCGRPPAPRAGTPARWRSPGGGRST